LIVIDLHDQGLSENHAGCADLLASTRLNQRDAERGGL
jgi:hypothetical protein